jgi:hypothetical protein
MASTAWAGGCEIRGRPRPATGLRKEQAEYIGVHVEGPYKPDHYRY